jgi:cytochrome P450
MTFPRCFSQPFVARQQGVLARISADCNNLYNIICSQDDYPLSCGWPFSDLMGNHMTQTLEYNPFAPHQLENPYPIYAAYRSSQPVFFSPIFQMWIVTRYDDVVTVLKDTARFSSMGSTAGYDALPQDVIDTLMKGIPEIPTLVDNDPPSHTRIRSLYNKVLTPRRVAEMEPAVRETTTRLVDQFAGDGQGDLVRQFAFPLPALTIAEVLGLEKERLDDLKKWGDDRLALMAPGNLSPERMVECAQSYVNLQLYLKSQIEDRRQNPRDDLLSSLITTTYDDGTKPTDDEIIFSLVQMLNAGHETTTDLIGNMIVLLLNNPDQLQALKEDPTLAENAVEEALRIEAPVQGLFRTVTQDTELGGVQLKAGDKLEILYASGNHDESKFENAMQFDIRRKNAGDHLSFGRGIHFCVGAPLARLEGVVALQTIIERLPNLRFVDDSPRLLPHFFLRGYEYLPLAWDVP